MALAVPWNQIGKRPATPNPYYKPTQPAQSPTNGYSNYVNALGFLSGQSGYNWGDQSSLAGRATQDTLNKQLFANTAQTQFGNRWANTEYGPNRQLLDLDIAGNNMDRAAQQRLLNPGGLYGTQQAGLDESRGLLGYELQNNLRGLGYDETTARRTNAADLRAASSDATARGATVSGGLRNKNKDLAESLADQLGQIDVGRVGANIAGRRGTISLNNEQAGLTENKAQTQDRIKQFDLQAQRYGIQGTQLKNTLTKGLEQLNMEGQITADQIMDKMNSAKADDQRVGAQLMDLALQYGGYFPK